MSDQDSVRTATLSQYRFLDYPHRHPHAGWPTLGKLTMGKCDHCEVAFAWKKASRPEAALKRTRCPVCHRFLKQTSSELLRYRWYALDLQTPKSEWL